MAIVINPQEKIENHLKSWNYLPFNPANDPNETHDAVIKGAALVFMDLIDIDFVTQGYCWASNVIHSSLIGAISDAVDHIEDDLSCHAKSEQSIKKMILDKATSLLND